MNVKFISRKEVIKKLEESTDLKDLRFIKKGENFPLDDEFIGITGYE